MGYTPGFKFDGLKIKCVLRYYGTLNKILKKIYLEHGDGKVNFDVRVFEWLRHNSKYYFEITIVDGGSLGNSYYVNVKDNV